MTLTELRTEAQKYGYKLVKDTPNPTLEPCICGSKRHIRMLGIYTKYYKCVKCGFKADEAQYLYQAKLKWNECVENARKENNNVQA